MRNSNLFYRAWSIKKLNPKYTFRKALIQSWRAEHLYRSMSGGNVVEFVYIKLDGTIRIASGTLPEVAEAFSTADRKKTLAQNSVVNYFDTDANGWRSFKADRLQTIF